MKRREFLKYAAACGATSLSGTRLYASGNGYTGRLLLTLQAQGGWDVSSFCDPKMNVPGEPITNDWATRDETRSAGNIDYAPYGSNIDFFEKYYQHLLVINGVDSQTNAHSVGELHSWSGRNSAGYPTLSAMFAAKNAIDIPLSYINFGGYSETAELIRFNRLSDVNLLNTVLMPNAAPWEPDHHIQRPDNLALVEQAQRARLQRIVTNESALPLQQYNAASYLSSLQNKDALDAFAEVLPSADQFPEDKFLGMFVGTSDLQRQMMLSVLAFKAGVSCASDLLQSGFDTHSAHDADHEPLMSHLTDSIDFLWTYAEQQGIADRLTLVVASDFSRTPFYNSGNGKDHWPIGSVIVMEQNPAWGNRAVGLTDAGQNANSINPATLQRDDANGTIIYPKHIHKSLRRYLGLENTAVDAGFPLNNAEDFDFFNPSLSTV